MVDEWVVVRVVTRGHEADWLRERLVAAGIDAWTPDTPALDALDDGPSRPMRVMVRPADLDSASALLERRWHEGHTERAEHSGALRTYQEWSAHRYDPGHYLGGTIAPELRIGELGPNARRRSALLLGVPALVGAAMWMLDAPLMSLEAALSIATIALYLAAAFRMATR
jgi:hypothetical protein